MSKQGYKLIRTDGVEYPIGPEGLTIGRSATNDVVVSERQVSRKHARLLLAAGRCWIRDEGSDAGTFINAAPVRGQQEIRPNDTLTIGSQSFRLVATAAAAAPAAVPAADRKRRQPLIFVGIASVAVVLVILGIAIGGDGGGTGVPQGAISPPSTQPAISGLPTAPPTAGETGDDHQLPEVPSWVQSTSTPRPGPTAASEPRPTDTPQPSHTEASTDPPHQYGLTGVSLADCARNDVVCVAVLDSGVDAVGNLVGRVLPGKDYYGENDTSDLRPGGGYHGTYVAQAVISAAPGAFIIPVKTPWNLMDEAIVWSVNNGADIINISPYGPYSHCDDVFDNLYNAIDHARAMGVPVFGAATCGWDDGRCTMTGRRAPADCEGVTGVGATYGGQIRYNTDQDVAYEVSGQAAPSWAAGYVSGYAANMLLEYPEIYDGSWLSDVDDHLLLALQCNAYYGQTGDIELACCGWAGIAFTCENDCTLEWCP